MCAYLIAGRSHLAIDAETILTGELAALAFALVGRAAYREILGRARAHGYYQRDVVLIAGRDDLERLHQLVDAAPRLGLRVIEIGRASCRERV